MEKLWIFIREAFLIANLQINYLLSEKIVHKKGKHGPLIVVGGVAGFWSYKHLFPYLIERDVEFYVVDFSWKGGSIDEYTETLRKFIAKHNIRNFVLVGYSMGGLVVTRFLQKYDSKILKKVISLGAPYYGNWMSSVFFWNKTYRDMLPSSHIVHELKNYKPPKDKLVCVYSPKDQYIATGNAVLHGSEAIEISVPGHNRFLQSHKLDPVFDRYIHMK